MVTLPREFTATRLPGYFWNTKTQTLFSLKVGGELREMKVIYASYWNNWPCAGYRVCHKGKRRTMMLSYLEKLECKDSEITVVNRHAYG